MALQTLLQQESDQVSVDQLEGTGQEWCPLPWRTPMSDEMVGNMFVADAAFTMHLQASWHPDSRVHVSHSHQILLTVPRIHHNREW
jgi:hypothetical protein